MDGFASSDFRSDLHLCWPIFPSRQIFIFIIIIIILQKSSIIASLGAPSSKQKLETAFAGTEWTNTGDLIG